MAESKELATQVPSDDAIVRRYHQVIAKEPTDIKRGEMVLVDRHGAVVTRGRFKRIVLGWRVGIYGTLIGGVVLALSGALAAGALVYLAGLMPTLLGSYRGTRKLMAIDVLLRQGHLDEAQRRFDEVPELRRRHPLAYCYIAGNFASHRGDYAAALTWWREGFPRSKGLAREALKLSIVRALLLCGRIAEAHTTFESVRLPARTDDVLMGETLTRIMFAVCDPAEERAEDELHDWARKVLAYSHTGVELAALGWAFERRGDEEMARLLASEAVDRMHYPYLATWWPALQQWLDGRGPGSDESLAPVGIVHPEDR